MAGNANGLAGPVLGTGGARSYLRAIAGRDATRGVSQDPAYWNPLGRTSTEFLYTIPQLSSEGRDQYKSICHINRNSSMKKVIAVTAMAASLLAAVSGTANAGTPGSTSNGQTLKTTGNNAAQYTDWVFGQTRCNETQHPQFDTVSCNLVTPNLALKGTSGTVGWISDLDHQTYGTFTYTVSADGMSYSGKATY
jgi:hypothetical protein